MKAFCATALFLFLSGMSLYAGTQEDTVLWYNQPAQNWNEALPVGNGRLGAMVFGNHYRETIQLNEESLWAGYKREADAASASVLPEIQRLLIQGEVAEAVKMSEQYMRSNPLRIRSYQSFGELTISLWDENPGFEKVKDYKRDLNLETGIASVQYGINGTAYHREVFVSAPDNVIVIRLTASGPDKLTFRLQYDRVQDATAWPVSENELSIQGQVVDLPRKDAGDPGMRMKFAGRILGKNKGGTLTAVNKGFYVENADEVVFYVTAATDYNFAKLDYDRDIDPAKTCKEILDKAGSYSYGEIKDRHIADHSGLFNRVSFSMGEPSALPTDERLKFIREGGEDLSFVPLYFQYGRYLLMNSSRAPGILPANLQGLWNKDMKAPWSSDFHTNINIQMNYWPAEVCNLSETAVPFSNLITALREPGRVTARKTYNSEGWTMNHLTNVFGHTAISDGVGWGTFPMAGPWLTLHQWEHYLFTGDKDYLAHEAYPSMKESAEFVLGYLTEDNRGYLVTAPSNSPENAYRLGDKYYQLTYGATMDIQIITELFNACIRASEVLGQDASFRKELRRTLAKLPPMQISQRYNTIQEWIEDYEELEPGHRHMSHLFGLYPGTTIDPSRPELFDAARRTIERRRFYNENEGDRKGSYTGWSRAWMVNFYARLFDGEEAWDNLRAMFALLTLNNMFNTHPPFQIDGNFGATAGIAEMLIQSHQDEIHLFPAVPAAWAAGEVKGLRARGGFEVDIQWRENKIRKVKVRSSQGGKCLVRSAFPLKSEAPGVVAKNVNPKKKATPGMEHTYLIEFMTEPNGCYEFVLSE